MLQVIVKASLPLARLRLTSKFHHLLSYFHQKLIAVFLEVEGPLVLIFQVLDLTIPHSKLILQLVHLCRHKFRFTPSLLL